MKLFNYLQSVSRYLNRYQLIKESYYSKSQFYIWLQADKDEIGILERKVREPKEVSEVVVRRAVEVIGKYPHFSAPKGQCYMIYHRLGYIPQHIYKSLKKIVKRLIFQEVSKRELLPARTTYKHERSENFGEIWAEDFTQMVVLGRKFYTAIVMDVGARYYLGGAASLRPNDKMVESPVKQAFDINGGEGPKRFLLSDNGSQYVSTQHGEFLEKLDIIQKRIPACIPEYNGSIECGIKEFKNVFYNVWSQFDITELVSLKEKKLLIYVQLAIEETIYRMNQEIPRPILNGITPEDIRKGIALERREKNRKYLEKEFGKKEVTKTWNRKDWRFIKESLFNGDASNFNLMTKFCFFLKCPLRKLTKLGWEVLGN